MASIKDNMEQLEELFRQDGGGYLLIGYETGMDKPHAAISYQLYPVNPDQDGMTYQFLSLLHVGMETARISAFVPDTRLEIYRFPCMSDVPSISRDIPVKEYITGKLLPHIQRCGLEPVVRRGVHEVCPETVHGTGRTAAADSRRARPPGEFPPAAGREGAAIRL